MNRPNNNGSRIPRDREENVQAIMFNPDRLSFRVGLIVSRIPGEHVIRPRPAGEIHRQNLEAKAREMRAQAREARG